MKRLLDGGETIARQLLNDRLAISLTIVCLSNNENQSELIYKLTLVHFFEKIRSCILVNGERKGFQLYEVFMIEIVAFIVAISRTTTRILDQVPVLTILLQVSYQVYDMIIRSRAVLKSKLPGMIIYIL